ncbi:hypothetical protein D3C87_1698310 [compost metagenome]
MQTADHTTRNFHRHFITPVRATNAQAHVMTAQPVIGSFVIDVEKLNRLMVFSSQLIEMGPQRVNAALFYDKFQFDFLCHSPVLSVASQPRQ